MATSEFKSYVPLIWYIAKYFAPYQSTHSASCSSPSFYDAPAPTAAAAALDVVIVVLVRFLVAVIVLCSALFFYSMSFALCCHYEWLLFIDVGVCVCLYMHRLPPKREWVPILRSSSVSRKYLLLRLFLVVFSSCPKDDKGVFPCLRANTSGISKRCMRVCANSLTKIVWFFVWTPQPTPLPLPKKQEEQTSTTLSHLIPSHPLPHPNII